MKIYKNRRTDIYALFWMRKENKKKKMRGMKIKRKITFFFPVVWLKGKVGVEVNWEGVSSPSTSTFQSLQNWRD